MSEAKTKAIPIDYFASLDRGNRILKVLHDIPIEKVRHGGYSEPEIKKALAKYSSELAGKDLLPKSRFRAKEPYESGVRPIAKELDALQKAGQVQVLEQNVDGMPRYKLSTNTLFYIHSLYPSVLDFKIVVEKNIKPPMFRQQHTPGTLLLDEIVLAPGSLILAGDHSALLGQPAVVLPIPLFLSIHATVSKYEKSTVVYPFEAFPDPYALYGELSCFPGTPIPNSMISDAVFKFKLTRVINLFQEKLTNYAQNTVHNGGYYVILTIRSQIPPCVGLGSSGALCAALAILLDRIINREEKNPLETLREKNLDQLFKDNTSRFNEIFLNAVEFEREIHGETSGVGPFASLVGGDCFTPIWYDLGSRSSNKGVFVMSEVLDQRKKGHEIKLNLKCRKESIKTQEYLSHDLGLAAVYTTQSRQDIKTTLSDAVYRKALMRRDCRRDFVGITDKLWKNLCEDEKESKRVDNMEDVITCVNLFGGYEEGYLKMLRAENEEPARDLIYRMRGVGLGAKYTGAGFGGDIILIGPREKVSNMLIPNYFPVHFTSVNLTYNSPAIDRKAHSSVVQKDDFVNNLLPQFLNRATRAWRSY